ncbi:KR domain-containing protein [Paenibacillus oralis]|uniref:KR domain-containing protein n=1 Tax=Paenibacillus oralis TaxID=2490856 RepID=A0A3P3U0P1_9BACL|nr:saccharopine dehydrogenase NADP-binding domain-containing protein [Paenibacillus oralis]RRJ63680.1 KR domain-containing protein [Paenibacillus oralis]
MNILILGGYGTTGRMIAGLLLQETDVTVVLAGRNLQKAQETAAEFNQVFAGERVSGEFADASDEASLKKLFQQVGLVVVASSTSDYVNQVAKAAIEARIDYLDIQYSSPKINSLKALEQDIAEAGCCFITDGGFHPGLAAVLVHYIARFFDSLEAANVASIIKIDWAKLNLSDSTIRELAEELYSFDSSFYKDGRWKKAGTFDIRYINFGKKYGKSYCWPMMLEEMVEVPKRYADLKETGFFVGGFNWFVDWFVLPVALLAQKVCPDKSRNAISSFFKWGLTTFSRPPYGTILKVEATGYKAGQRTSEEVSLYHSDGYMLTAIPVVACLLQYLDGSIKKTGLWTQANLVEPERLMRDMIKMGVSYEQGSLS